ncbi:MAG TPA: ATP-binding protein [Gemmatimonadales bacterium]|nr:ATP-binding protein [Gemmatimonadales bacterium]
MLPAVEHTEFAAAILQATITLGLALLCLYLHRRYRKPYFGWWAAAWGVYALRIGAIVSFLATGQLHWLYWHQVATGWTALALLWAALVFSQQVRWRPWYLAVVLFPPVWSYVAIYRLDHFLWAAGPAVLFLSLATLWTGWVFLRYHRRVGSSGAAVLAGALLLWGVHHLDYPLLRARGAWNPWGYYLDILFILASGAGILLLVIGDLQRGLGALSALSSDLQRRGETDEVVARLLGRPLTLAGVTGSAIYLGSDGSGRFVRGVGACAGWTGTVPGGRAAALIADALSAGRPVVASDWIDDTGPGIPRFAAVLPVFQGHEAIGALVIVGDARDPFTALDEGFLRALGQQVGAALENADLYRRLQARTAELERLSARMVQQHEEERRRISLELHDETAQVFSAVKLQLGVLQECVPPEVAARLQHVVSLVDAGIRSIRSVTNDLRPTLLDDLGLLPALRALATDFAGRSGLEVTVEAPQAVPALAKDAELALFRALQEALANVARHAAARRVAVRLAVQGGEIVLSVEDDGRGLPAGGGERNGRMGLAGMRERISALGGVVEVGNARPSGVRLRVRLPVPAVEAR